MGARRVLKLTGELDIATAPELESALLRLCASRASEVLLDLTDLEFLDSTGFRAILTGKDLCEGHGCRFLMTRAPDPVERVFDLSGVLRKLPFV